MPKVPNRDENGLSSRTVNILIPGKRNSRGYGAVFWCIFWQPRQITLQSLVSHWKQDSLLTTRTAWPGIVLWPAACWEVVGGQVALCLSLTTTLALFSLASANASIAFMVSGGESTHICYLSESINTVV